DAELRVQMRAEIKKLHRRLRTTFVYVTHDQVEAMTMADRIVLLHEGIIQQYDVPGVIYDRPANVFVATFIGSPPMNIVKVKRDDKGMVLQPGKNSDRTHNWQIALGEHFNGEFENDMFLGIRPEHILINADKSIPSLELPCNVELIEPMGAETYLYLECNGHSINARVEPSVKVEVGQKVTAHIPVSRFHLFKQSDTTRIKRKAD
ncbi:MAG TPA: TOBE domain-containing protein, partial [Candidatus Rifleibacterium sp.]|nr:TOBE domain-containing protein [Candidatus Rifleibacterium sp.]